MSITGTPETPAKAGNSMADIAAGMYAYTNILAALMHRQQTGEGQRIEVVGRRHAEAGEQIEPRDARAVQPDARAIRGQASKEETLALLEEGVDVLPLPALPWLKETLQ